jgi:hypothetical protein
MKDKQQSTFEDILLELMVQNETLDKIQTNTLKALDLAPVSQEKEKEQIEKKEVVSTSEEAAGRSYDNVLTEICQNLITLNKSVLGISESVVGLDKRSSSIEAGTVLLASYAESTNNRIGLIMEDLSFIANLLSSEANKRRVDSLQDSENTSEMISLLKKLVGKDKEEKDTTVKGVDKPATFMEKLLGALGIIGGLVTGFVAGIVGYFSKLFKGITTTIAKLLKIDEFLARIGLNSKFIEKLSTPFKKIGEFFKDLSKSFGELFSDSLKAFKELSKEGGFLGKIGKFFTKLINYMKGLYDSFFSKFGKFFGIGKVLGVIVGKLMIFWDVFQSIKAAFDKFGETGDLGEALGTGIKELLGRVIGAPLDLLKSAVSWILGKFGFSEAEEFLDSFDFTELINTFLDRLLAWGRQTFEKVFQTVVDIWDDITDKFKSGDFLGGIIEIFRGLAKFLLALPMDLVKNAVASVGEWFGADMSSVRKFSFTKLLGGTNTATEAESTQSPNKGILQEAQERTSVKRLKEEQERVDKHIAEQDKKLKEEADKKAGQLKEENKDKGIFGWFKEAEDAFMKAMKENMEGGQTQAAVGAMPSTVGSELAAIQNSNDELKASAATNTIAQAAPAASKKPTNISSQSVTYNSSNIPDKTSWMTMPLANWGH